MVVEIKFCRLKIYLYLAVENNNINYENLYAYRNISALELI